jgi:ABC-type multidrug transport system fused ATPase/permease subunit
MIMQEHEFPLDDPTLRKYVKLEIERETAELKVREMKARFVRIAWRSLIAFLLVFAVYAIQSSRVDILMVLVYAVVFSIITNSKTLYDVTSNWRDVMKAKRELQSWNAVITDYNNRINKEDCLKEKES